MGGGGVGRDVVVACIAQFTQLTHLLQLDSTTTPADDVELKTLEKNISPHSDM